MTSTSIVGKKVKVLCKCGKRVRTITAYSESWVRTYCLYVAAIDEWIPVAANTEVCLECREWWLFDA
jgi:hypothetical protein